MRRLIISLSIVVVCVNITWYQSTSYAQTPSADEQIVRAVEAAPEEFRDGARVIGYNASGEHVILRDGTNQLVCLADDPSDDRFHVACYHESLEPFMKRGRELRSEGVSQAAVDSVRRAEIQAGELSMPKGPAALYSMSTSQSGGGSAGVPADASRLHVVYVPYATEQSTGLSTEPTGGQPWLMEPGAPWAHIMISLGS